MPSTSPTTFPRRRNSFRVHVAASLDGFIASPDGSTVWKRPFETADYGLDDFLDTVATLVMGRTTYEHLGAGADWPFTDKRTIVVTSRSMETAPDGVETWLGDLCALVAELESAATGDTWVVGGAKAIRAFLDLGAIDHLDLLVIPVLLGDGKPLFERSDRSSRLTLLGTKTYPDGVIKLSYVVGQPG